MLTKSFTGTWMPAWVPESTTILASLLVFCSAVQSATAGYDGSMLNGLNILPVYVHYFNLNAATSGLQTASVFVGGCLSPLIAGVVCDRYGRRPAIFWGSSIALIGVLLQTAAQNIAMFVVARIILGFGNGLSVIVSGVYLAEAAPNKWRAWLVGLLNDFYYIGALIAAGITLGSSKWNSTWAWRAPSLIQGLFSLICIVILPFVPESPRWLIHEGHLEAGRIAVAQTNTNGSCDNPAAIAIYQQIISTLEWEKGQGRTVSPMEIIKTPVARKQVLIAGSVAAFSQIAGNVIASYFLGDELTLAGITESTRQLEANIVLNVWCLLCALIGTQLMDSWGRKPTTIASQVLSIVFLCIIGGLTKVYADSPETASNRLIYGNTAAIFLFQGFYSVGWTPILYLYPPEILSYSYRANGMAFSQFMLNASGLIFVFIMPIALQNIGWKTYIANAAWDVACLLVIIFYWVETKGKTLEEMEAVFEGEEILSKPLEDLEKKVENKDHNRQHDQGDLKTRPIGNIDDLPSV